MNNILSKKLLIIAITTLLILVTIPSFSGEIEEKNEILDHNYVPSSNPASKGTHTVLAEYGTSITCGFCRYANQALKNIYWGGTQDFCVVTFVSQNSYSSLRLNEYNLYGYPTVWFDGGYKVVVGAGSTSSAQANYNTAIDQCEVYPVYDVDLQLSANWLGSATMQISVSVQNNEPSTYDGHIRVYVIEKNSTFWSDTNSQPYGFGFLNYAFNQDISINTGNTWQDTTVWNGNDYGFGSITQDNTMVVAAVFNDDFHQGYSYPPSSNPFNAYYVDESTVVIPVLDSGPPELSNIEANPSVQAPGENIEISADVIDDAGVNEVKAVITYPDDIVFNETMTPDTGDTYTYESTFTETGVYSYYIWTDDTNGNQNNSDVFTFEIMNPHITDLSSNWNFVSLSLNQSINKTDLIVKYNAADHSWADAVSDGYVSDFIFGWDRSGQSYTFNSALEPGHGYWIYVYTPCQLWIPIMSTNCDNYITDIEQNWNIVGLPDDENVSKTLLIIDGISWADAVTGGYVSDYIFGWDRLGQSYTFTDVLEPGYAYWIYAYLSCKLGQ